MTTLYTYWRSSAAYRVRIALNLKGVPHDMVPVHLVKGRDGVPANRLPDYAAINPQMRVPALRLDDGTVLVQSPAILEWLEETHPTPALLPADPVGRAKVRALVSVMVCDTHPLVNVSVPARLRAAFGANDQDVAAWVAHFLLDGAKAVEAMAGPGPFLHGDAPTLADVCVVPLLFSMRRFSVPLDALPKLVAADAAMRALPPVEKAAPANQPDAE